MNAKIASLSVLLSRLVPALCAAAQDPEAIWAQVLPSSNLTWTSCYSDGLQCARLAVPLDYKKPNAAQGAVALLKFPSTLNPDDKYYRGPILFNPGGPGGSGIDFVLDIGALARQIVGPEYDLIGFDPRGVSRTTPTLRIFETEAEASTFSVQYNDDPSLGTSPGAVGRTLARFQGFGNIVQSRASDVAPYVSTALVARDMLTIVKAHGFDKLVYLGTSYGSLLGQSFHIFPHKALTSVAGMTFASMFPENVGRIVVDGIVDAADYYSTEWRTNLLDTDNAIYAFYQACSKAGPQACAIYDKSPNAIKSRVDRLLARLTVQPVAASVGTSPGPLDYGVIDYGILKGALFTYLYNPYGNASTVASILAALDQGDATPMWQALEATGNVAECSAGNDRGRPQLDVETMNAIMCSDGEPVNDTIRQLQAWYEGNARKSSFAGTLTTRIRCAGWKVRPVERFSGYIGGNTSFPLLFLSNKFDPITPLINARSMSKLFPGSGLLLQNAIGHTTFSATSTCTLQALSAYVRDGTLPKPGTVCDIEEELFPTNGTAKARRIEQVDGMADVYHQFSKKIRKWSKSGLRLA